jgi:hypothetical protein
MSSSRTARIAAETYYVCNRARLARNGRVTLGSDTYREDKIRLLKTNSAALLRRTTMRLAKNWDVLLYALAAIAAVVLPIILTAVPRASADFFPQPHYDDVVRLIQSSYR